MTDTYPTSTTNHHLAHHPKDDSEEDERITIPSSTVSSSSSSSSTLSTATNFNSSPPLLAVFRPLTGPSSSSFSFLPSFTSPSTFSLASLFATLSLHRSITRFALIGMLIIFVLLGDTLPSLSSSSSSSSVYSTPNYRQPRYPSAPLSRSGASASGGYLSCTTSEQIQEGIEAVRQATLHRRTPNKVGGAPYSVSEYHSLHPCTRYQGLREPSWYDENGEWIGYLVLSSEAYKDRLSLQLETWGSVIPPKWFRSYSDVNDPGLHMITLPDLEGKPDYHQAQHRVLKGLQHAVDDPEWSNADFIIILGDDTYINVPELRLFTAQWNPDIPVMFGWIWHRSYGSWPGGGSGMLFTRAAAHMIAQALYTSLCPFEGHDDVTLGYCCWRLGIPQVHSPMFDTMGEYFRWFDKPLQNPSGLLSIISIHKTTKERMYNLHTLFHYANQGTENGDGSEEAKTDDRKGTGKDPTTSTIEHANHPSDKA